MNSAKKTQWTNDGQVFNYLNTRYLQEK